MVSRSVASAAVWPNARAASIGPQVAGGVVLSGHTDVVPVDGQAWTDDPFTVRQRDGKLIGRCRGAINGAHGLSGDAEGNLYLCELPPQEITKLERLN